MTQQTTDTTGTTQTTPAPETSTTTVARPEWLPESHWDGEKNSIKDDFGTHYSELATFHKTQTETQAALAALAARKPEDIKFEVKLPEGVKPPEGMDIRIDEKDPRVPVIREMAIKRGWDQDTVNELVTLDARMQIEAHAAEQSRIQAEDTKLGANAKDRKAAVGNWLKGLKDNKVLSSDEYEAVRVYAVDAASVTALEKIIAKVNGSVPGNGENTPPREPAKDHATRIWGDNPFQSNPQAKVS